MTISAVDAAFQSNGRVGMVKGIELWGEKYSLKNDSAYIVM
ncbi:hypothetical protein N9809_01615 [Amylibacter sp.]|nr:hypothetical protein [Amylibacter sp.]